MIRIGFEPCSWDPAFIISRTFPFPFTILDKNFQCRSGIRESPAPGTDRSELVRDFQNFVGPGSDRSQALKLFLVLVRSGARF